MNTKQKKLVAFDITQAQPQHIAAVFYLLPQLLEQQNLPSKFFIAYLEDEPSKIVGAGALIPKYQSGSKSGFVGLIHVLENYRLVGIGTKILDKLEEESRRWGTPYLYSLEHYDLASPAGKFLKQHSFTQAKSLHRFLGEADSTLESLSPLVASLYKRKRVDPSAKIINLKHANIDNIVKMFSKEYNVNTLGAKRIINTSLSHELASSLSVALVCNGTEVAFLLAKVQDEMIEVAHWITTENYRMGWPAALLLHHFIQTGKNAGFSVARYCCNDETKATLNIAKKAGARTESITHVFVKEIK